MIDIEKAEREFEKYASNYDMKELRLYRKVTHTFRVEKICERIAISIGMNEEEINVAKIIGLLHDIARFKQYTEYKTFSDIKSIDHGEFGIRILEEDNYIRKYIEDNKYDEIIKKAIRNHNKYSVIENLSEEEKIFCQIIRDADKIDIMYQAVDEALIGREEIIGKQTISENVIEQFKGKKLINSQYMTADIDRIIRTIAFIYDLNFKESYKIIKENNYIDKIFNRFDFKNEDTKIQMEQIKKIANDYINNQIK